MAGLFCTSWSTAIFPTSCNKLPYRKSSMSSADRFIFLPMAAAIPVTLRECPAEYLSLASRAKTSDSIAPRESVLSSFSAFRRSDTSNFNCRVCCCNSDVDLKRSLAMSPCFPSIALNTKPRRKSPTSIKVNPSRKPETKGMHITAIRMIEVTIPLRTPNLQAIIAMKSRYITRYIDS